MITEEQNQIIRRLLFDELSDDVREELLAYLAKHPDARREYDELLEVDLMLYERMGATAPPPQSDRAQKLLRGKITRQQHERRPRGDVFTLCRAWQESNSTEFDAKLFADSWTRFEESGMLQEGRPLEFAGSLPTEGQALGGGDRPPGFETLLITLAANVVWDFRKRGEKLLGEKREKAIKRHLKLVGNISPHEERARRVLNFLLDILAGRQP
ncbi:MAG: hypothetical protein M5U25_11595 [Planctomycetota bacterium]|nr:hypothetical protein [Planctomycetota bacterium]